MSSNGEQTCDESGASLSDVDSQQCVVAAPPPGVRTTSIHGEAHADKAEPGAKLTGAEVNIYINTQEKPTEGPEKPTEEPKKPTEEPEKHKGPRAHLICDRMEHGFEFQTTFIKNVRSNPTPCIQIYLIEGISCDLPSCFIDRLYYLEVTDFLPGAKKRTIELTFPDSRMVQGEEWLGALQIQILDCLGRDANFAGGLDYLDLLLPRLRSLLEERDMIFIRHSINWEKWDGNTAALLQDYFGFLTSLLNDKLHIVVFFIVEPSAEAPRFSLLRWKRPESKTEAITTCLEAIQKSNPCIAFKKLSPLGCIERRHVNALIANVDPKMFVEKIHKEIDEIFKQGEKVRMKEIGRLFTKEFVCGGLEAHDVG